MKEYEAIESKRSALIVTIQREKPDSEFTMVTDEWKEFLRTHRPLGVVFYHWHFKDKIQAKQLIDSVKEILGDRCFLAADMEGGRVDRLHRANPLEWNYFPSAEELAKEYLQIESEEGEEIADNYVINQYCKMFEEMRELGLNLTFGPDCDINFYKHEAGYQLCKNYRKYFDKKSGEVEGDEMDDYYEAMEFKSYLADLKQKNLHPEEKEEVKSNQQLDSKLEKKFQEAAKYSGYIDVIGDRSYGINPQLTAHMAYLYVKAAEIENILYVLKHAPGHGRPLEDTHKNKAATDALPSALQEKDLIPYKEIALKKKNSPLMVMPAHVHYREIDPRNIGTCSAKVLNFIEKTIGEEVIFVSDDMAMHAALSMEETKMEDDSNYPTRLCDIVLSGFNKSLVEVRKYADKFKVSEKLQKKLPEIWRQIGNISDKFITITEPSPTPKVTGHDSLTSNPLPSLQNL